MSVRQEREVVADFAEMILDGMPSDGMCLISLRKQTFLLNIFSYDREEDACRLLIHDEEATGSNYYKPDKPYDQLTFRVSVFNTPFQIELLSREGYPGIEQGEEIDFLRLLLAEGKQEWRNTRQGDWDEWSWLS